MVRQADGQAYAIDEKSPYTGGHCQRVPVLTMMLAEAVNETDDGPLAGVHVADRQGGVVDFNGMLRGAVDKSGPHLAEIRVNLTDKYHRDRTSIDIVRALRAPVLEIQNRYPGSRIHLVEDPPGPPVRTATVVQSARMPEVMNILLPLTT